MKGVSSATPGRSEMVRLTNDGPEVGGECQHGDTIKILGPDVSLLVMPPS